MRSFQAISALLLLLTVPVIASTVPLIANSTVSSTFINPSLNPSFDPSLDSNLPTGLDMFEHEDPDSVHDYINGTSGEVVRLSKRQGNGWFLWRLQNVVLFCEKPGLKGSCTWFRTVTDWCFNLHPGDVNSDVGTLPGGFNKIGSAYNSWQTKCILFKNKHCDRHDKQITLMSDEQTPDDMGELKDHTQSLLCVNQFWTCKDSKTGLMYAYQVPPRPKKCDIFNPRSP